MYTEKDNHNGIAMKNNKRLNNHASMEEVQEHPSEMYVNDFRKRSSGGKRSSGKNTSKNGMKKVVTSSQQRLNEKLREQDAENERLQR